MSIAQISIAFVARGGLIVAVTLIMGVLGEIGFRMADGYVLAKVELPDEPPRPREKPLADFVARLPHDNSVNPAWIDASPPPLNAAQPPAEMRAQRIAALDRQTLPATLYRQWNSHYVANLGCIPNGHLWDGPPPLRVFDAPDPISQPIYRQPLNTTTPHGLVTNRFGWRGPDLPIDKPAGTIRIAFVGASTTIGAHWDPFSYPEYVVHWLNLWAASTRIPVRFDGINAGREGLISTSSAAIVRQELLPMEVDLVVNYEGANQFSLANLIDVQVPPPVEIQSLAPRAWADRAII